jgi:hypothetical protein
MLTPREILSFFVSSTRTELELPFLRIQRWCGFRLPVPTAPSGATKTLYVGLPEIP